MSSDTAIKIMDKYLKRGHSDKTAFILQESRDRVNNNMRLAQVEMIRSHWDDMDEVTQARAKRTLEQLGAYDGYRTDDSHGTFVIEV